MRAEDPVGKETILLVEDGLGLRLIIQSILQELGYQVIAAANANEALDLWVSHRNAVDLLLTDLVMPESMSGQQLAQRLRSERPELKVLYTSGFEIDPDENGEEIVPGVNFLKKPFRRDTLIKAVRRSLDSGVGVLSRSAK